MRTENWRTVPRKVLERLEGRPGRTTGATRVVVASRGFRVEALKPHKRLLYDGPSSPAHAQRRFARLPNVILRGRRTGIKSLAPKRRGSLPAAASGTRGPGVRGQIRRSRSQGAGRARGPRGLRSTVTRPGCALHPAVGQERLAGAGQHHAAGLQHRGTAQRVADWQHGNQSGDSGRLRMTGTPNRRSTVLAVRQTPAAQA